MTPAAERKFVGVVFSAKEVEMVRFLWICLAGAAGTGARYLLSSWVANRARSTFPLGTLTVRKEKGD